MQFVKCQATLENKKAKEALKKIIGLLNDCKLSVEDTEDVLGLALASIRTGIVCKIKVPKMEDVVEEKNGRRMAGPLMRNYYLRES